MSKTMLVNVTHVEESRVAILEDGVLAEYEIETLNRTQLKGNIYNAVVESVHGGLDAAFLKIDKDLKGFLALDEVNFKLLPSRGERGKTGRIGQHLVQGQRLIVQVTREPFAGKPPSVTTYFSLPGRYLVLMPGVDSAGISRKISDGAQRERLKKLVDELKPPEGFGLIVRTAGLGQTKTELQRDMRYLLRLWDSVQRASEATPFPGLVYRERDLVIRTMRDYFTPDIREVWIDSKDTYERALEFIRDVMPNKAKILRLYTGERPLFNKFNLEEQIESIYKRRVPLPSGGEIVIDGTEALTAIDVNSARSSRQGDQEEIVTQTNLEAAAEIARQLRLRDLGGLVVIDFIDMMKKGNQKKVEKAMREALRGDKARYDITPISKLGLMEIARQRIKGAKMGATYATCPACDGHGLIKNVEAAALAALRKLQTRGSRGDAGTIRLGLPPEVAVWILNHKRDEVAQFERRHDLIVEVVPDEGLLRHESRIEAKPRETGKDEETVVTPADVSRREPAEAAAPAADAADEPAPSASEEPVRGPSARRRRRRRSRQSRAGLLAGGEQPSTPPPTDKPNAEEQSPEEEPEGREPSADGGQDSGGRRRRRRRRRRRPAGQRDPETDAGTDAGTDDRPSDVGPAAPQQQQQERGDEEEIVPRGVNSQELMPAAVGGGSRRGGRRRRKGGN